MQNCNQDFYPDNYPIAMAYVPWQEWKPIYELDKAFEIGTIFPVLNKPFEGRRCQK